jgi:hypothetical protein
MSTTIPTLNAEQLRILSDAASGYRGGDPFWLIYRGDEAPTVVRAATPPADAVFCVETREVEDRPKPTAMIIDCDGSTRDLSESYDAVFWSEAAVEKFVFPYYASKSLWEAASVLEKLSKYWYGTVPPDTQGGADANADPVPLGSVPYALAHTPDSDWNTMSQDGIGSDFHLLVKDGAVVRAVRLSDLPDLPASAERADRAPRTPAVLAAA